MIKNPKIIAGISFGLTLVCLAGIMISMPRVNVPFAGTFFMGGIASLFVLHSAIVRLPMKGKRKHGVVFLISFQFPILFLVYESIRREAYWVTPGIIFISLAYAVMTHALLSALMDEPTPNKTRHGTA